MENELLARFDAMDARLNTDMLFPIYDYVNDLGGSNFQYHVIGWAAFKPTEYLFKGSGQNPKPGDDTITGSFDHVTWTGIPGGGGGPQYGPVVVGLVS